MSNKNLVSFSMNIDKKYMTVSEFAKYEGVTTKTINRIVKKGKVTAVKARGKSKYRSTQNYIHYTQLTNQKVQEQFLRDRGLLSGEENNTKNDELSDLKPWQKEQVDQKLAIVKEYVNILKDTPKGRLTISKKHFAVSKNVSLRTLDRWKEAYKSGGYYSLVPNWNPGKQEKILDEELQKSIENQFLVPFGPPIKKVYEDLIKKFSANRENLPTYRTVAAHIHSKWTKSQQMLIRDKEQWNRKYSPHVRRDWNSVTLNEVWIGDAKQIDVACIFRGKPVFSWWTAYLDARSRKFVGWILTPIHDSWSIAQSFVYAVEKHGPPQTIYIDRGKPYKSRLIAGAKIKEKVIKLFDDLPETEIPGVFRELGAEIFYAAPYNGREKIIEPAFKIFTQRLRHLPGYRGHNIKTRPKKLESEIKSGKLLSFEELSQEIDKLINERNARPHSTTGKIPNGFYENYTPKIPSKDILAYLLMDANIATVRDATISIKGMLYRGENLWKLSGEKVEVRRDPKDLRRAAIIYKNKLFEFASLETPSHYRDAITLESVNTASRIRRRINKWRKAVIENEGVIDDPLTYAVELENQATVRSRDIRPANSKIRSFSQKEKLAKDVASGLENQEWHPRESAAAEGKNSTLSRLLRGGENGDETRSRIRLVKHLTINDP